MQRNEEIFKKLIIQSIKEALDDVPTPPYSKEETWVNICKSLFKLKKSYND